MGSRFARVVAMAATLILVGACSSSSASAPAAASAAASVPAATSAASAPAAASASAAAACTGSPEYVAGAPLLHPYLQQQQAGFETEGGKAGKQVQWLTAQQFDEQKEISLLENAFSFPCLKGMAVIAATPGLFESVFKEAATKGIPAVQQVCLPTVFAPSCLALKDEQAFATVAKQVADGLKGKGNVVISIGDTGVTHNQRRDFLINYWKANNPDIKVLGVLVACDNPDKTVACAENALSTYPTMNAYVATGNQNAVGAATVFPKAGRTDILISGVDDDPVVVDGIKKGTVAFTLQQDPVGQGRLMFLIPYWMVSEGLKPVTPNLWIDTPGFIVDKTNVDSYKAAQAISDDQFIVDVKAKDFTK